MKKVNSGTTKYKQKSILKISYTYYLLNTKDCIKILKCLSRGEIVNGQNDLKIIKDAELTVKSNPISETEYKNICNRIDTEDEPPF